MTKVKVSRREWQQHSHYHNTSISQVKLKMTTVTKKICSERNIKQKCQIQLNIIFYLKEEFSLVLHV